MSSQSIKRPRAFEDSSKERRPKLKRLDKHLTLNPKLFPIIQRWALSLPSHNETSRKDRKLNLEVAFSVILANLVRNRMYDEEIWTEISRKKHGYTSGRDNPNKLNLSAMTSVLDEFKNLDGTKYLEKTAGNKNLKTGQSYNSRYRLTDEGFSIIWDSFFRRELGELEKPKGQLEIKEPNDDLEKDNGTRSSSQETTNTLIGTTLANIPLSPLSNLLFLRKPPALIQLRESKENKSKLLEFEDSDTTRRMEQDLRTINTALKDHWIDLLIPDATLPLHFPKSTDADKYALKSRNFGEIDFVHGKTLFRVFNNSSFEDGGRFYGGWWMNIRSGIRRRITINWFDTVEVDFSNLQIAMLYALKGKSLSDDAYSLDGLPVEYRKLVKTAMLKIINATGRIRSPKKSEIPDGWTWKSILNALKEKHSDISEHFNKGEGIKLQKKDSDIANNVMIKMLKTNQLVLPIHDSFIVKSGYEDRLIKTMKEEYELMMGQSIAIKEDTRAFPRITADDLINYQKGAVDLADRITKVEELDGFKRYRERKSLVQRSWGEEWFKKPSFNP